MLNIEMCELNQTWMAECKRDTMKYIGLCYLILIYLVFCELSILDKILNSKTILILIPMQFCYMIMKKQSYYCVFVTRAMLLIFFHWFMFHVDIVSFLSTLWLIDHYEILRILEQLCFCYIFTIFRVIQWSLIENKTCWYFQIKLTNENLWKS